MKYTVKIDEQTYAVEITDLNTRPVIAIVDGEQIEVWPESNTMLTLPTGQPGSAPLVLETRPAPPASPAVPTGGSLRPTRVVAPIPGVVVAIAVKPGDEVSPRQELCTIEAMKMRNAIRSGRAGVIAAVHISPGQTVNHNDLLFEFTE